jgi:precorrin-8X/cobalt-precorrin-8 methylmutase
MERKQLMTKQDKVGLILIGHGSKLPHNRENLEKLAQNIRESSMFSTVEISFMVRNTPTISDAIDTVVKKGVNKIVLVPAFIAQGVHTTQEIPELIEVKDKQSQLSAKGIKMYYGEPIGADQRIAVILEEKALKALGQKIAEEPIVTPFAGKQIFDKSMTLIRPEIQEELNKAPSQHASIIERVVHTTADPEFAKLLEISDTAVESGVAAIKAGAKVITDVKMIKAGINEARLAKFGIKMFTYVDDKRAVKMAHDEGITRSTAASRLAVQDGVDGAIFLIGNAPTAAFELAKLVEEGKAKQALIVAPEVG